MEEGYPTIHDVCKIGDLTQLTRLVQVDPDLIHALDHTHHYPLHYASRNGHVAAATFLLDHGALVDCSARGGYTPLFYACMKGHLPMVDLLLQKGADPTVPTTKGGTSPLTVACFKGHVPLVHRLLRAHSPATIVTGAALWFASYKGHLDVVKLLLQAGADPTWARVAIGGGAGHYQYGGQEEEEQASSSSLDVAKSRGHEACYRMMEEWGRAHVLIKARHLHDVSHYQRWATGGGEVMLPCMGVSTSGEEGVVAGYVVEVLKDDLFVELMAMMGRS